MLGISQCQEVWCGRQRESAPRAAEEGDADVDSEFDDEDTFLNLDDVLEGERNLQCSLTSLLSSSVPCTRFVTAREVRQ